MCTLKLHISLPLNVNVHEIKSWRRDFRHGHVGMYCAILLAIVHSMDTVKSLYITSSHSMVANPSCINLVCMTFKRLYESHYTFHPAIVI